MIGTFYKDEGGEERADGAAQAFVFTFGGKSNALLGEFKLRNLNDSNLPDIPMYVMQGRDFAALSMTQIAQACKCSHDFIT